MRRARDAPRGSGAWAVAAVVLATAATFGAGAAARPFEVEDLLQREALGEVTIAPGGRWLLVEQRKPLAAGARFDFGRFNARLRTELKIADLAAGTGLRPLVAPEPGVGYGLGPVSPDGARAVVFRLTPDRWELGLATLASGAVRWTGITPEISDETRTLQWLDADRLAVIATAPGAIPWELRAVRPQATSPTLWAAAARGETAVTAVGSGRHLGERPRDPPKRLVTISAADGAIETLATGDFTDLEVSPSGRRLALMEAAEDIPLKAGRQVQGAYGIAVRRMRLRLLDLGERTLRTPCPSCDTLASLLAWSPDDELLAYVRDDGRPWTEGRLVRLRAEGGPPAAAAPGLRPAIAGRPERLSAGWWGRDVVLLGRDAGASRDDWWRVSPAGPIRLTASLPAPLSGPPAVARHGLLVTAGGAAWRIGRDGRAHRVAARFTRLPRRGEGIPDRTQFAFRQGRLAGVLTGPAGARAALVGAAGAVRPLVPLRAGERLLAAAPSGAVAVAVTGGGAETLVWRPARGPDQVLARLNLRLADLERSAPVAIAHAGPGGEAVTSWLFLPQGAPASPPLVVVPYPGAAHAAPPDIWDAPAMAPAAALVGNGYAVLVPSLPARRDGDGPAEGLAERVLAIVAAAAATPGAAGRFDGARLGLWGHSFGGYATAAIVTQTDRFAAAVATAAPTDLVSFHGQFSPFRRMHPEEGLSTPWTAGWTESLQGDMGAPPWAVPDRYRRNSPLMQADRIATPMLLAYGELDGAHPGQAEALFSALVRQDKDAILLTYWGEGHLFASPGNIRDLYRRAFAFLDAHLRAPPPGSAAAPPARPAPGSASSAPRTRSPPRR